MATFNGEICYFPTKWCSYGICQQGQLVTDEKEIRFVHLVQIKMKALVNHSQ